MDVNGLMLLDMMNQTIWPITYVSVIGFITATVIGMTLEKYGQMRFVPYAINAAELSRAMLVGLIAMVLLLRLFV